MNRNGRWLCAAILGLVLGGGACTDTVVAPRPNVVIFVWDTCRADRVQPNGYALPTTPNLAELAKEGTTFRHCYTPSPWTPPAHASLFTGLLPRNHGLRERMGDRVKQGIPLLAETLRDAGWDTVCVSANAHISSATGLDAGFVRRIGCFESKVPGAQGMDVGERVKEWLDGRPKTPSKKPVFLFVNLMQTHVPYTVEAADVEAVRGKAAVEGALAAAQFMGEAAVTAHTTGVRPADPRVFPDLNAAYDAAMRNSDRMTGRILGDLRAAGLLEGAFIAVCGDHGENLGEHGALGHVQSVSDHVLHVPLVVRWPGRLAAGAAVDAQVRLQDVYPTVLEATGVATPPACGTDAVTLAESPLRSRVSFSSFCPSTDRFQGLERLNPNAPPKMMEQMFRDYLAVREPADRPGARKFVSVLKVDLAGGSEVLREELYDVVGDPAEDRNLLSGTPTSADLDAAARLRRLGGR